MNILFITSEAEPFCKTGGLADVAGSLPVALAASGQRTAVLLPLYDTIAQSWRDQMTRVWEGYTDLAWRHEPCALWKLERRGVTWYFVQSEHYFRRGRLYGEYDDGERFAFFCRAAAQLTDVLPEKPDVVHCNDWQTALVPVYLRELGHGAASVFTIHNIEYQGRLALSSVTDLLGLSWERWHETLEMGSCANAMKAGMMTADAVTTVSPTYAGQLLDPAYACGLESVVRLCEGKLRGVLNGIDVETIDPRTAKGIAANFGPDDLAGKAACKAALQRDAGLEVCADAPVVSIVSRLVGHKGTDLVVQALDGIVECGCQLLVLGQGETHYENAFREAQARWPGRVSAQITYSDGLARRVYAGSDLLLMPSRSEPCGLSQMIAMRYGTVPIVRSTGGLRDTVLPPESAEGCGFVFEQYDAYHLLCEVRRAAQMLRQAPDEFAALRRRGMTKDFSWDASAREYLRIYESISGR